MTGERFKVRWLISILLSTLPSLDYVLIPSETLKDTRWLACPALPSSQSWTNHWFILIIKTHKDIISIQTASRNINLQTKLFVSSLPSTFSPYTLTHTERLLFEVFGLLFLPSAWPLSPSPHGAVRKLPGSGSAAAFRTCLCQRHIAFGPKRLLTHPSLLIPGGKRAADTLWKQARLGGLIWCDCNFACNVFVAWANSTEGGKK